MKAKINTTVGVSKGTLNIWLKNVEFTYDQKERLLDHAITGREKARHARRLAESREASPTDGGGFRAGQ